MKKIINGSHRNEKDGYYEWWYFHFFTSGNITANIVLHETDIFGHSANSYVSISIYLPDSLPQYHRMKIANDSISKNTPYLQTDDKSIIETEKSIDFSLSFPSGVILEGSILKLSKSLSIEDGILYKRKGKASFWVVQVPYGIFRGILTIKKKNYKIEAGVYQDHQWGDIPLQDFVSDWVWGHFGNKNYTVIFFEILTQEGIRISRFAKASKQGIDFSSKRNKTSYLDMLVESDNPHIFKNIVGIEFPLGGKIEFMVEPRNLLRSRMNEDHTEFMATYLRWISSANYTLRGLDCSMHGMAEYFRIRKQNNKVLIVLVGFSCAGKSTIAKKLSELCKLEFLDQNKIYHSIAISKGYKRSRDWLKEVGSIIFTEETVKETIKCFRSISGKTGAVIDASYGLSMHSILHSDLSEARIIVISVLANRNLRLQRMMGRINASRKEADKELVFRDNFLKKVKIEDIMSECDLEVINEDDINSAVEKIVQWLIKENIK